MLLSIHFSSSVLHFVKFSMFCFRYELHDRQQYSNCDLTSELHNLCNESLSLVTILRPKPKVELDLLGALLLLRIITQVKSNQISFIAEDKKKTGRIQLTQPQLRPIT